MAFIDQTGRAPYFVDNDTTRNWLETYRSSNGELQPNLVLRFATDTNYIFNRRATLYGDSPLKNIQTKAMMNLALPGMRMLALSWAVQESAENTLSSASFECLNCLPVSKTSTRLDTALDAEWHSLTVKASYVRDGRGVVQQVLGNRNVYNDRDSQGIRYREENVVFREFVDQQFTVESMTGFPDPHIPDDDDNDLIDDSHYPSSSTGVGAYYVLIDQEVIRVYRRSGNVFFIAPGGRAINGRLQKHYVDANVTLLGFAPTTGDYVGLGMYNVDDYEPYKAILRPGACLTSYEGYGRFENYDGTTKLNHEVDIRKNYAFTGYWFITGVEPSFTEDGKAIVKVDMQGPGYMFEKQKISQDLLQRMKTRFGEWRIAQTEADINGETIWGAADHRRNIPGDWVDFDAWDPALVGSYPLQIKTEFAQHKEFFDHMRDTELGKNCEFCREELAEFQRKNGTAKSNPKYALLEARAIGRHIYKQSLRVMRDLENAGPIKTYIRLMATIAAAAWDHPVSGSVLAQRFTKIPSKLYDNIRNIETGLIFNGQLDFKLNGVDEKYMDFTKPTYNDDALLTMRKDLISPFESSYDKTPFSQPMYDLAEINNANFWMSREGYPVFVPKGFTFRPSGAGWKTLEDRTDASRFKRPPNGGEWFMSYGGSIAGYSHSLNADSLFTQVWVTAETAFEDTFTVAAAGTGFSAGGQRVMYSPPQGNKEGLALTSGVQQVETVSLDNIKLGLDWNTEPANWGVEQKTGNSGTVVVDRKPALYDGSPQRQLGDGPLRSIRMIQQTINFFITRRYINAHQLDGKWWYGPIDVDGKFGKHTKEALKLVQEYLRVNMPSAQRPTDISTIVSDGIYKRSEYLWIKKWFEIAQDYIEMDIWWYVHNGREWEEYIAAITGVPVPLKPSGVKKPNTGEEKSLEVPEWVIDDKGFTQEREKWHRTFAKSVLNVGNQKVDESINQATARSIQSNTADPRIQPGDIIWAEIPGFLGRKDALLRDRPPYTNGIHVQTVSRTMDLQSGLYTADYSGFRYNSGTRDDLMRTYNSGYDFIGGNSVVFSF